MTVMFGSYELHPACALFPPMSEKELVELADDIAKNGQLEPIVLHEGKILDGRNRLSACVRADVSPKFTTWKGEGESPTLFVISKNKHRRHLSPGQLAMLADDMRPLLEAEAKERQKASQFASKEVRQNGHEKANSSMIGGGRTRAPTVGKTHEQAAVATGVSPRAVQQARELKKKSPEVAAKVREGKQSLRGGLAEVNARMSGTAEKEVGLPKDDLGQEIPRELCPTWGAMKRAVVAIDSHLQQAQRSWTEHEKQLDEIAKKSRGAAKFVREMRSLLKGPTGDVLRDFSGRVRELAPFAVCLNCAGSGVCPGKKCQRIRLAGKGAGSCACEAKACGGCDGAGLVTAKQKAAAKHEAKKAG